jgi:CheY-like chemotaxis protein/Tfp pilus assembly protein PilZ
MNATDRPREFLLRAEIRSAKETLVSYARELTRRSVFVVTDWMPPLTTQVEIRISFPSLFEPVDVRARVAEHRPATGVGSPAGITLQFDFDPDSTSSRAAIDAIVRRLALDPDPSTVPVRREYRVLLVEDNSFIGDMFAYGIGKFFAKRRSDVVFDHAADAASAREKLAGTTYDLVIVDYYLPAEDGASFIAGLRRDPRFARAPIVAISVGGRDAREATISAGADLFLDKPVVLRDLFETLKVLSLRGALA